MVTVGVRQDDVHGWLVKCAETFGDLKNSGVEGCGFGRALDDCCEGGGGDDVGPTGKGWEGVDGVIVFLAMERSERVVWYID